MIKKNACFFFAGLATTTGLNPDKFKEFYWDLQQIDSFSRYKKITRKLNLIFGLPHFDLS